MIDFNDWYSLEQYSNQQLGLSLKKPKSWQLMAQEDKQPWKVRFNARPINSVSPISLSITNYPFRFTDNRLRQSLIDATFVSLVGFLNYWTLPIEQCVIAGQKGYQQERGWVQSYERGKLELQQTLMAVFSPHAYYLIDFIYLIKFREQVKPIIEIVRDSIDYPVQQSAISQALTTTPMAGGRFRLVKPSIN